MDPLHIGLDLDNTIISYDSGWTDVAVEIGVLPADHSLRGKEAVKSALWRRPNGEQLWMRLQGQVYGRYIDHGQMCEGVPEFLREMHKAGAKISIVSHKTKYGHFDADRVDLWDAALSWLEQRGLFDCEFGLLPDNVHFLETRQQKLATIGRIGCHIFVDDLTEVLRDPGFPRETTAMWFAGKQNDDFGRGLMPHRDWAAILRAVRKFAAGCVSITRP